MDLSRRFNHSQWFRLLTLPYQILKYKWRLLQGKARFVTERPWRGDKAITNVCGHCGGVIQRDVGVRAYQIWGVTKFVPIPLPVKIPETEEDDVVMTYYASHHYHFPLHCSECGTLLYNAYAIKILKILVIIFY